MFSLVSGIYDAYLAPVQLNVLVVGASGGGKTTLLERIKVTQFSKTGKQPHRMDGEGIPNVPVHWLKHSNNSSIGDHSPKNERGQTDGAAPSKDTTSQSPKQDAAAKSSRQSWICPAPRRYSQAKLDDNDEDDPASPEPKHDVAAEMGPIPSPIPMRKVRHAETGSSMESVDLMDGASRAVASTCCVADSDETSDDEAPEPPLSSEVPENSEAEIRYAEQQALQHEQLYQQRKRQQNGGTLPNSALINQNDPNQQFDLKPKCKMLPLDKIRRTVGMNLGKLSIHGANCNFWDLGGRMETLWERYYADSDAVIFVWKIPHLQGDSSSEKVDSETRQKKSKETARQLSLLEEVRSSIPDDVPFLVMGHIFSESEENDHDESNDKTGPPKDSHPVVSQPPTDVLYSTARLLPHYHNTLQALFFVNAANGQGVKSAMDWLVPMAKRQLKVREARPDREDGDMLDDENKK
mmetsp:Transcript_18011/g.49019  ORF Transcript_18011/g.49019 Transcript_18011/m.49019 type:complete len:465 (+) Transcript_18011:64-1458(+)